MAPGMSPRGEPALTHLQRFEAESIHIMREVAAEAERPVMLYSVGKDSAVKGLYAKARAGQPENFAGIDSPYEAPEGPEVTVDTTVHSAADAAELIVAHLTKGNN
jgi:3'-phosphoadenosine 5'-phosphosulfate sulfotransferase (PAPS reductase)/FAD synthetase